MVEAEVQTFTARMEAGECQYRRHSADDGSNDKSRDALAQVPSPDPAPRVISTTKPALGDNRMKLAELCNRIEAQPGIRAWDLWQQTDLVHGHPWSRLLTEPSRESGHLVTYYPALYGIAQHERPKVILEIGTGFGLSTATWILGDPDLELLITLDLGIYGSQYAEPERVDNLSFARSKCEALQERIGSKAELHFIRCNTQPEGSDNSDVPTDVPFWENVPELRALLDKYPVDLLFIDGKHTGDGCINDLHSFAKFVRPSGLILCDDMHEAGERGHSKLPPYPWAGQALKGFREFIAASNGEVADWHFWRWPAILNCTLKEPASRPFGLIRYSGGIDGEKLRRQAVEALEKGDAETVVTRLREARPLATDAQIYCELGLMFARRGAIEPALNSFKTVVSKDPANKDAHHNLALIYAAAGYFDQAEEEARQLEALSGGRAGLDDRIKSLKNEAARKTTALPQSAPPVQKVEAIRYPVNLKRVRRFDKPVVLEKTETFDTADARAINQARMEHLLSLGLLLRGLRILDLGGGVGHLAQWLLKAGAQVLTTDIRPENVARARELYPELSSEVADVERDDLTRLGQFDAVFAYGLLYHLENPLLALRNIAALRPKLLMLETIITDSILPVLGLAEETGTYSQAVAGIAVRPSPAWVAMALNRTGFEFVYGAATPPNYIDYSFEWRNDGAWNRDGHNLRCVFIGSTSPLSVDTLVPLLHD